MAIRGIAREPAWASAQIEHAAQPTPEGPDGAVVATSFPEGWKGRRVRVRDLNP